LEDAKKNDTAQMFFLINIEQNL